MATYTRPDVYALQTTQQDGPVKATATGFGTMFAITEKGPVQGVLTRTRSFPAWKKIYGNYQAVGVSDAAYEAELFFKTGGFELLTGRICHYSDLDDKTSYTGGVAFNTSITDGVAATAAYKNGAIGPFELAAGWSFLTDVDNAGAAASTFNATAGYVDDTTTYPVADQSGNTLILAFDGGSNQTVTFGTATTVDQIIEDINQQIYGGSAENNGGQLRITSDKEGTGSSVSIVGGTHGLTFGAATAGTGNVADIRAVTATEVKTIVEAATTATVAVNADGSFTITSPTTGTSSELDFQSGTALTALGLSVEVITGTDAGATYDTLKLEAGYHGTVSPGTAGNNLAKLITQNPKHVSNGAGNDLAADATAGDSALQVTSLQGLTAKSVIKIWDGTNTEYHEVDGVRAEVSGSTVTFYVDITDTLTNGFTAAATQIQSQEFDLAIYENGVLVEDKFKQMSTLDTADNYFVTLLNDEDIGSEYVVATDLNPTPPGIGADLPATDSAKVSFASGTSEITSLVDADWIGTAVGGTGIYALDTVREFMPICTVNKNTAVVFHSAATYCESRLWMEYVGFVTAGLSAADAVSYRHNILGVDSSWASLYAGGIKVFDPNGAGSNPKRSISGVGALMGLRAKVDALPAPNGGPWNAPAGEGDYGRIPDALDVVTDYSETDMGLLNDAHINVIKKFGTTSPVLVWGARTLDASVQQKFRYINTQRFFSYVEKSIVDSTRWAVFRNNDFRLWGKLKDRVDTWLTDLMPLGAFPTSDKALAFYVKVGITDGVMTAADRDDGIVRGKVGLAPHKAGEFIEWQFAQYESGFDISTT